VFRRSAIVKTFALVAAAAALLVASTGHVLFAYSSELTSYDLTTDFLSCVVGIDMTKYSLAPPPPEWQKLSLP
jgi:hypothetical protein